MTRVCTARGRPHATLATSVRAAARCAATLWAAALCAAVLDGCGDDAEPPGAHFVSAPAQRGEPDIESFRAIVDAGLVPAPEVLEPVSFFSEHTLELPPAECGDDLCVHASLAVAPRFAGGNWTMAFVGMNTALERTELAAAPVHVALVIDETAPLWAIGGAVRAALLALVAALRPVDRVTLVPVRDDSAEPVLVSAAPDAPELAAAIGALYTSRTDAAASYEGLAIAAEALEASAPGTLRHLVFLTSGAADSGITSSARIVALVEALAQSGVSMSVLGAALDEDYDARLPAALGALGTGRYVRAETMEALIAALQREGERVVAPIATELALELVPAPGYRVGRVYGAPSAMVEPTRVAIAAPLLFLGSGVDGTGLGGIGTAGLFVELIGDPAAAIDAGAPAYTASVTWRAVSGEPHSRTHVVVNSLAPGENPPDAVPRFGDSARGKPYVMLDLYLALRFVADFHGRGDCPAALALADQVMPGVERWQLGGARPDIAEDLRLLSQLRQNVARPCVGCAPVAPGDFAGGCMAL